MQSIRRCFYQNLKHPVSYNLANQPVFDSIIDLTLDVTNRSRISQENPQRMIELLNQAKVILTDSVDLAKIIREAVDQVEIIPAPFGYTLATDCNTNFVVGVLNYDSTTHMNNLAAQGLYLGLDKYETVIYGDELAYFPDAEITNDLDHFAGKCDVLLLPGMPQYPSPIAVPLSVMMAGTAVITLPDAMGYRTLLPAKGVLAIQEDARLWNQRLKGLRANNALLKSYKNRNRVYARRISQESTRRVMVFLEENDQAPKYRQSARQN